MRGAKVDATADATIADSNLDSHQDDIRRYLADYEGSQVAGSNPVGHSTTFRISKPDMRK